MASDPHQPLKVRRYRLARADALAYERLPGELSAQAKFALIVWLALPGAVSGFLAGEVSAWAWWLSLVAMVVFAPGVAMIVSKLIVSRRAARHPIPEDEVTLEQWGDHLAEFADGRARFVAMETIGRVIDTPNHVFVCAERYPIIVPRAAFEDERDMRLFAGWLDEESSNAQP
ncbi:hypothetical protein [Mesorhizobium sp. ES1-1]|uniref:hypothetical protein n=1 Tax=Mesorhizobium sp. ES1-1 TaxID=2876629 RepID=UPI001CCB9EB1|nr:hypothetical protein [Mesorhizobium sp. ES1-1]MBZ9678063.1 hypothetical protein [Mesorhizobium sp. ES1-1]